jgi:NAD(P)-dependent dehydrogenase (short-subunit alcohol dehydrogenase family)
VRFSLPTISTALTPMSFGPGADLVHMTNHTALDLSHATAVVTGASRGFGHATALALAKAGANVVGVARTTESLAELHRLIGPTFTPVTADVSDPAVARDLIRSHRPSLLVLNAGATPPMGPIHELTWEEFGRNWSVDTRHAFNWLGEALRAPLQPGSAVVAISSGAALRGSPLSGGYAGAKATIRFISGYAAAESTRLGLGIRFVTLLPQLTPATALGKAGVAGYAARQGVSPDAFIDGMQPILTPERVGREIVGLVGAADLPAHTEYLLTGNGLQSMPG